MRGLRHDQLSTYGIGGELNKRGWHSVARQLVAMGLLSVDYEYGSLRLTDDANRVLRGDRDVQLRHDPAETDTKAAPKTRKRSDKTKYELATPDDERLFDKLRSQRRMLAQRQGVPPYVIFHDATLLEMTVRRPTTAEALAAINGVGTAKLEKYGEIFIGAITDHVEES